MRQPFAAARSIQSWRPISPPQESTTRSLPAASVRGAISSRRCACVDASITRSETRMSSSSERKGAGAPRLFRKVSAFSRSRAVAPARWRPAMPSSRARQSCRPIAPSPTTPTSMIAHGIMPPGTRMTAAQRLRQPLERLYREFDYGTRVELDAIRFPLRYAAPRDRELVGLLTACLAYGRVDLFSGQLEGILARMGPSPAAFVAAFDPRRDSVAFDDFWYRFNRPRDLVAFCIAARDLLARFGTLEKCFLAGDADPRGPIGPPLERFARAFLEADLHEVFSRGRRSRGYRHLFPLPSIGGPCKRLLLFLRWMVRREAPDFGLWAGVSPARLLIPVDTHVENMSRAIGLTRRRSRNWRMAEEITGRLAVLDPADPVKYDFALCHTRMAGDCLDRRDAVVCPPCGLRGVCRHWKRGEARRRRR